MSKTSNSAKQKWNAAHYTQVKVSVNPEIANGFKAACAAAGTSMAGELEKFMEQYSNASPENKPYSISVKRLGDRRKAMNMICMLIAAMRDAEEEFIGNMPENLQSSSRYEMAEERIEMLDEVLDAAESIYEQ